MKDTLKRYLISSGVTFIAVFAMTFCASVMDETFVFSKTALTSTAIGAVGVAFRALAKIIWEAASYVLSTIKK